MTKEQIKAILDRVLSWPLERQQDVAEIVMLIEEQDNTAYELSDEQLAEVQRRRAKKNPTYLTLDEARARLRRSR
jgi:hypothetical protein